MKKNTQDAKTNILDKKSPRKRSIFQRTPTEINEKNSEEKFLKSPSEIKSLKRSSDFKSLKTSSDIKSLKRSSETKYRKKTEESPTKDHKNQIRPEKRKKSGRIRKITKLLDDDTDNFQNQEIKEVKESDTPNKSPSNYGWNTSKPSNDIRITTYSDYTGRIRFKSPFSNRNKISKFRRNKKEK